MFAGSMRSTGCVFETSGLDLWSVHSLAKLLIFKGLAYQVCRFYVFHPGTPEFSMLNFEH